MMHRLQHPMARLINKSAFFLRITAPQKKDYSLALFIEGADGCIRKPLPPLTLMRASSSLLNGQCCIQQQHALLCPMG